MVDICKCSGANCPIKEKCYRFTSPSSKIQYYFKTTPYENYQCKQFMEIDRIPDQSDKELTE